jgi:hypothetical protein
VFIVYWTGTWQMGDFLSRMKDVMPIYKKGAKQLVHKNKQKIQ